MRPRLLTPHILDHGTSCTKELRAANRISKIYKVLPGDSDERKKQLSRMLKKDMELWYRQKAIGTISGQKCYEALLALGSNHSANALFKLAHREGILSDEWFATRIINFSRRHGNTCLPGVHKIRAEMKSYSLKRPVQDTASVYISFLTAFTLSGSHSQARTLLKTMDKLGIQQTTDGFISIVALGGTYAEIKEQVVKRTENKTMTDCDISVYHEILKRFSNDYETAKAVVSDMRQDGFTVGIAAINILLNAYGCSGTDWNSFRRVFTGISNANTETFAVYFSHGHRYILRSSPELSKAIYKQLLSDYYAAVSNSVHFVSVAPFVSIARAVSHFNQPKRLKLVYDLASGSGVTLSSEFIQIIVTGLRRGGLQSVAEIIENNESM